MLPVASKMDEDDDALLIKLLSIPPNSRSISDNSLLYTCLRKIEGLHGPGLTLTHREAELRKICRLARHRRVPGDTLLYSAGDPCDAWFILLTGSVLIETSMFLPRACFGSRLNGSPVRQNDCLALEMSDLVVIDYPVAVARSLPAVGYTDTHNRAVSQHRLQLLAPEFPGVRTTYSQQQETVSHPVTNMHQPVIGRGGGTGDLVRMVSYRLTLPSSSDQPPDRATDGRANCLRQPMTEKRLSESVGGSSCCCSSSVSTTSSGLPSALLADDSGRGISILTSVGSRVAPSPVKANGAGAGGGSKEQVRNSNSRLLESDDDDVREEQQVREGEEDEGEGEEEDAVEADEEDDAEFESSSHESLRDAFWESILKEPSERTDDDIQVIMDTVQQLPAFSNLTTATCRALCGVIMVAVVREAGQVVLQDEEKLDTWSVILSGTVEVLEPDGTVRELTRGDSFGVRPSKASGGGAVVASDRYCCVHRGVMQTVTDDCQFAWVAQADYVRIMSREGDAEVPEMGEGGRVVLVYEAVQPSDFVSRSPPMLMPSSAVNSCGAVDPLHANAGSGVKRGRVVTKGTPEKLIEHLVADLSGPDITYPEDFLLTYRTFLDSPLVIVDRLLAWHRQGGRLRCRVNRVVLLWVHNHFNDFEDCREMMQFVGQFDGLLAKHGTAGERRLFQLACSTKARLRRVLLQITSTTTTGTVPSMGPFPVAPVVRLPFSLIGGRDGFGLFVSEVSPGVSLGQQASPSITSANVVVAKGQLRPGDQLLEVNGRALDHHSVSEAVGLIRLLCSTALPDTPSISNQSPSSVSVSPSACRPISRLRLLVVYNPVQYHQLVNLSEPANSCSTNASSFLADSTTPEANQNGLQARSNNSTGDPMSLAHLLRSDRAADGAQHHHHQRLPVRQEVTSQGQSPSNAARVRSCSRGRSGQGSGGTAGTGSEDQHQSLASVSSTSAAAGARQSSLSAHSSPSRAGHSDTGSAVADQTAQTVDTGQRLGNWLAKSTSRADESVKLNRSSSQPDLSAPATCGDQRPWFGLPPASHFAGGGCGEKDISSGSGPGTTDACVIRVWRASESVVGRDQLSKLVLLPCRQTTALEATRLAVLEFGLPLGSSGEPADRLDELYSLHHVTVDPGPVIKQSRLAHFIDDLPGRLTLNSRYYLKVNRLHETLVTNDIAKSILSESLVTFMQIPPEELAIRLTLDDYRVFRSVQATEYIDEVFGLAPVDPLPDTDSTEANSQQHQQAAAVGGASGEEGSTTTADSLGGGSGSSTNGSTSNSGGGGAGYATGHGNLDRFTDLVNREAYWAPTEICAESVLNRRVELVKRFIKLANFCRQLRNFNTMFCILMGLHQTPVGRLKQTWERLPNKYQKLYRELSMVLETSRNFFHYRSLLASDDVSAPMIPYLPLVLKDLTFIHLGNPSVTSDGLVNFVKLRMLAKEIRAICRMCNVAYSLETAQRLLQVRSRGRLTGARVRSTVSWSSKPSVSSNRSSTTNSSTITTTVNTISSRSDSHDPEEVTSWVSLNEMSKTQSNTLAARSQVPFAAGRKKSSSGVGISSSLAAVPLVNVKKLYEAWLLTLRIRTYLANVCVQTDPETLSQMSIRLEPRDSKGAPLPAPVSSVDPNPSVSFLNAPADPPSKPSSTGQPKASTEAPLAAVSVPAPIACQPATATSPKATGREQPGCSSSSAATPPLATPEQLPALGGGSGSDRQQRRSRPPPPSRGLPPSAFSLPSPTAAQSLVYSPLPGGPYLSVGQLPPRTVWPVYPPAPTSAVNSTCTDTTVHLHQTGTRPQFVRYCSGAGGSPKSVTTGNKSFLLDSLIPTPQRIPPAGLGRTPSGPVGRCQFRLPPAVAVAGGGKNSSPQLLRPPQSAPHLHSMTQQAIVCRSAISSTSGSPLDSPYTTNCHGIKQLQVQQTGTSRGARGQLQVQQQRQTPVAYRYPTANNNNNNVASVLVEGTAFRPHLSHQLSAQQQHHHHHQQQKQQVAGQLHHFPSSGSAAVMRWSANRQTRPPPPYDVAVALQQAQRQHHHQQQQPQPGTDVSRSPAGAPSHQLSQLSSVANSRRPLAHPLVRSLASSGETSGSPGSAGHRQRHESTPPPPAQQQHYSVPTALSQQQEYLALPRTVSNGSRPAPQQQQRPVPPPYQEVVGGVARSGPEYQGPVPAQRPSGTTPGLALSLASQVTTRSPPVVANQQTVHTPALLLSGDPRNGTKS